MSTLLNEELHELLAKDAAYRARFAADPKTELAKRGVPCPDGADIHFIENHERHFTLIVGHQDLYSEEQLRGMPPELNAVISRTFVDPGFKDFLMQHPVEALFLELGFRVPDGTHIEVREAKGKEMYIPVWVEGEAHSEELDEFELEEITGGAAGQAGMLGKLLSSNTP